MRIVLLAPVVIALTACSVVPNAAWTFDPTHPQPRPVLATSDAVRIDAQVSQLNIEKNAIRSRIAAEPDAHARLPLYEELHRVGMALSPLERQLSMYALAR